MIFWEFSEVNVFKVVVMGRVIWCWFFDVILFGLCEFFSDVWVMILSIKDFVGCGFLWNCI